MTNTTLCGAMNDEGAVCQLPKGHHVHQDGVGDNWGIRWGHEAAQTPVVVDYTDLVIAYDRQRLWWVVTRASTGAVLASGPTNGTIPGDARAIKERLEHILRERGSL